MAQGAITALRSLGLQVPSDVGVAGFDDIPTLQDYDPPLTTFRLPLQQIGEQAVALAMSLDDRSSISIEGSVVVRESTDVARSLPMPHRATTAAGALSWAWPRRSGSGRSR